MAGKLCIAVCQSFVAELQACVAAEGWTDVQVLGFPARCGRPPLSAAEWAGLLPADCTELVIVGRSCLGEPGRAPALPASAPPLRRVLFDQCFDLVASPSLVRQAVADGAYLVSPGWLAHWPDHLAGLGFDGAGTREMFHEVARYVLLLDTGVDAQTGTHWQALQAALALKQPGRRLDVGLDHARAWLARVVLEWRLEDERRRADLHRREHLKELADHLMALDQLRRLSQARDEAETIAGIEELFRMLFAPKVWHFVPAEDGVIADSSALGADLLAALQAMRGTQAITPSGRGLLLRLEHGARTWAFAVVDEMAFPDFIARYAGLATTLAGLSALALESVCNRRHLVEAEKMASLGFLVAGVAHEINTPVGIGLGAATTLQTHTREIGAQFAERRMTHAALAAYLDLAGSEAELIADNLERVGRLVDAFRQVAVQGKPPEPQRFALAACLQEVVDSVVGGHPVCQTDIRVDCDPALVLFSTRYDWVCMLRNLLLNSFQHGFKGLQQGQVHIAAQVLADGRLRLDYRDDGLGLAPEARKRIFDPFYTTDLRHGMGLGMHLVYNLVVHRFKGVIRFDGHHAPGARFVIEVPLAAAAEATT